MRTPLVVLLLLALAMAGCSGGKDPAPVPAPTTTPAAASFLHDLSPQLWPSFDESPKVFEHHRIAVREGIELDAYTWRPDIPEKVPVILTITPYYGGGSPEQSPLGNPADTVASAMVPRGYAVGFVSVTGTGDSGGCFIQGGTQEAIDLAGAVEFFGTRDWSNGNVGLIGVSYDGTTPQETWVQAPSHLKTIVPVSGISDLYKYQYVNGVPISVTGPLFTNYYWLLTGLSPVGLSGGIGVLDPLGFASAIPGEACVDQVAVQEASAPSLMDGNKDAYWQERDFVARLRATPDVQRAPVLYVHGLQDYNVKAHNMDGWLEAVRESGVPFKALLGQWGHAWPDGSIEAGNCMVPQSDLLLPPPSCRADWWNGTLLAWFDYTLKGRDTGILAMPAFQVQDDLGIWRGEATWPPVDATWRTLHPSSDGSLGDTPGSGSASYHDYFGALVPAGTIDLGPGQALFLSEPFAQETRISGLPAFSGRVTASGSSASLVLTLAVRNATGIDRSINFAAQSLNHVADPAAGRDIAGIAQDVTVSFLPSDDVVLAGERLVLIAAGNNVGSDAGGNTNLQPKSDGSTITLDLATASLRLPIDTSILPEDPQPFEPRQD